MPVAHRASVALFPGQGTQAKGMGAGLFDRYPEHVALAGDVLGYDITRLCLEDPDGRLDDTRYTQPVTVPAGWSGKRPVVIGAGPSGLFAGLILAQMGFRPIIVDRGKVVRERTKDTWGLWRRSQLDPESGRFTWHPGVGFVGTYDLVLNGRAVRIRIGAKP